MRIYVLYAKNYLSRPYKDEIKKRINSNSLPTTSSFRLKIKEAIHINWGKPELNKQVRHTVVSIAT